MSITSFRVRRGLTAAVAGGALVAGVLAFQAPAQAAAPNNDNFADATVISGTSATLTASNVGATTEAGEPVLTSYQDSLGATVWYRWTAPVTADYAVSTAGSDFDTTLGVYTGTSVAALRQVATNDDFFLGPDDTSSTGFTATAGTTYDIQVGGYGTTGETGDVHLALGTAAIAGSVTYESDADPTEDPQSGCFAFFTDPTNFPASVVGGGCGSGPAAGSASYAVGLLPAGQYYLAAENGQTYFYPSGTVATAATKITIPGGNCTLTGFNVNLNTGVFSGPTGKDCSTAPACISAKSAVGSATAALASDKAALTKDEHAVKKLKKKIKKAKKHHEPTTKLHKKLKKAKKKAASATKTVHSVTAGLTTAQRNVTTSC